MNFRFEPILNLRVHYEDKCRIKLMQEETFLAQINKDLCFVRETIKKQERDVEVLVSSNIIDISMLICSNKYLHFIRKKEKEIDNIKSTQQEQVNIARDQLVSARKDKKTMEKLREQFNTRMIQDSLSKEQHALDEVGISLYHRNKR